MNKKELSRRECEVKYKIESKKDLKRILSILDKHKFTNKGTQLETDYVPDTIDFLCRENNIIFRLRLIKKENFNDILLTLKVNNSNNNGYKDATEYEYFFSEINKLTYKKIKKIIFNYAKINLTTEVHKYKNLKKIIQYTQKIGLTKIRTLVEKKRTSFERGSEVITLDEFPRQIGKFMEIETKDPISLKQLIILFKLPKDKLDTRNYGTIIKESNINLPEEKRGIIVFNKSYSNYF